MVDSKSLLLAWGLYALGLQGPAMATAMPTIETRQTGVKDLCKKETFATVVKQFGGDFATGSPYTWDTEPAGTDGIKVLYYTNQPPLNIPDICGVRINITPNIAFEIYLPYPTKWNKRFLTVGNGAFAGKTSRTDMFSRAVYGWAVMSTNTGHEDDLSKGLSWGLNKPDLQKDWAWRAMNSSVQYAKAIVDAYYKPQPDTVKNYYSGCSTGGRQGVRQIEVDPKSFHGMLIGAPAWNVKSAMPVLSRIGWLSRTYDLEDREGTNLAQRLYDLVVRKCDNLAGSFDTVTDQIVSDSAACLALFQKSDINTGDVWKGLDCQNDTPSTTCITIAQRQGFMALLGTFKTPPRNDSYAGDGFDITSIKDLNLYLATTQIDFFDDQFSTYFLGKTVKWDSDANGEDLLKRSNAWDLDVRANANGAVLNSNPNLRTILYTGTADGSVSSLGTRRLFDAADGASNNKLSYFELPGMPHCVDSGIGAENVPWYIGGTGLTIANAVKWYMDNTSLLDAEHDALTALTEWVEKHPDTKPVRLVATAFRNATAGDWTVSRQRPICASPARQTYNGSGDVNAVGSWKCE